MRQRTGVRAEMLEGLRRLGAALDNLLLPCADPVADTLIVQQVQGASSWCAQADERRAVVARAGDAHCAWLRRCALKATATCAHSAQASRERGTLGCVCAWRRASFRLSFRKD